MRLVLAAFAATVAIATPIVAQQMQKPGSKSTAAITGGSYTVDPGHTLVRWEVDHFGFTPYWGLFGGITGTATLDRTNPAASKVDITIPVSKVTTANAGLTAHLLRAGKVGVATWIGMVIGTIAKVAIVFVMIGVFLGALLF